MLDLITYPKPTNVENRVYNLMSEMIAYKGRQNS